jgi:hypothetical protein
MSTRLAEKKEELWRAERRQKDVFAFGATVAENRPRRTTEQRVALHCDPSGQFWFVGRGGSVPDFERGCTPEEAAQIATTLHLTAAGRRVFAWRGLDASRRERETLTVRATWRVER